MELSASLAQWTQAASGEIIANADSWVLSLWVPADIKMHSSLQTHTYSRRVWGKQSLNLTLRITGGGIFPNAIVKVHGLPGSGSQGQSQGHLTSSAHISHCYHCLCCLSSQANCCSGALAWSLLATPAVSQHWSHVGLNKLWLLLCYRASSWTPWKGLPMLGLRKSEPASSSFGMTLWFEGTSHGVPSGLPQNKHQKCIDWGRISAAIRTTWSALLKSYFWPIFPKGLIQEVWDGVWELVLLTSSLLILAARWGTIHWESPS